MFKSVIIIVINTYTYSFIVNSSFNSYKLKQYLILIYRNIFITELRLNLFPIYNDLSLRIIFKVNYLPNLTNL